MNSRPGSASGAESGRRADENGRHYHVKLERWVYVGRMEPLESDKVQILTIGPGGSEVNEEEYYESDTETGKVPRDDQGKPTSELLPCMTSSMIRKHGWLTQFPQRLKLGGVGTAESCRGQANPPPADLKLRYLRSLEG